MSIINKDEWKGIRAQMKKWLEEAETAMEEANAAGDQEAYGHAKGRCDALVSTSRLLHDRLP